MEQLQVNNVYSTLGPAEEEDNSRSAGDAVYEFPLYSTRKSEEQPYTEPLQFNNGYYALGGEVATNTYVHENQYMELTQPEGNYDYVTANEVTITFEYTEFK